MSSPERNAKLEVIRAAERYCFQRGVDALTLEAVAREAERPLGVVTGLFHDEGALLDAILERHQSPYERRWEEVLPAIDTPRGALSLLVSTIASLIHDEDGGPAYVAVAAQMCVSPRHRLTSRPATTTPTALKLMVKLIGSTRAPFELLSMRFDRFAAILFSSTFAWYLQGAARLSEQAFVEDLVDTLEFVALAEPTDATQRALRSAS